jgi:hypothetical protein
MQPGQANGRVIYIEKQLPIAIGGNPRGIRAARLPIELSIDWIQKLLIDAFFADPGDQPEPRPEDYSPQWDCEIEFRPG